MNYNEFGWTALEKITPYPLLLPVGSVEQHGLRLPFGVDSFLAEKLCYQLSRKIKSVIAPVIFYGARSVPNSGGGDSFPGTIKIRGSILTEYYKDIIYGYLRSGFTTIIIINAHWENETFILEAIEILKDNKILTNQRIMMVSWWNVLKERDIQKILPKFAGWKFEHAGRAEMALMLYYYPEFVISENNVASKDLNINSDIYFYPTNKEISNNFGALSACNDVTREMGKNLAAYTEECLFAVIKEFLKDDNK